MLLEQTEQQVRVTLDSNHGGGPTAVSLRRTRCGRRHEFHKASCSKNKKDVPDFERQAQRPIHGQAGPPTECKDSVTSFSCPWERSFLESLSSGVITEAEMQWLTINQTSFNRAEEATAASGRLIDAGSINLAAGCLSELFPTTW